MGMCLEPTPEMGEYATEVRRGSFRMYCGDTKSAIYCSHGKTDSIEISMTDVPKIRAALDQVEAILKQRSQAMTTTPGASEAMTAERRVQHIRDNYERWGEAALERACGDLFAHIDAQAAETAALKAALNEAVTNGRWSGADAILREIVQPMLAEAYTCGLDDEYAKANGIKIDHSPDGADAYAARIIANLTSTTREDDNG